MSDSKPVPRLVSRDEMIALRRSRVADTFKLDPIVKFKMGDKEYSLEFNNAAVKRIYRETGHSILADGFGVKAWGNPEILSETVLAGLLKHHPKMTMEEVDNLLDFRHTPYIMEVLRQALDYFMPDMSDVKCPEEDTPDEGKGVERDPTVQ